VFRCQDSEVRDQMTDEKQKNIASYLTSVFYPLCPPDT